MLTTQHKTDNVRKNVTLQHVCVPTVAKGKHYVLNIMSVCLAVPYFSTFSDGTISGK
jgi:hypothetical protein